MKGVAAVAAEETPPRPGGADENPGEVTADIGHEPVMKAAAEVMQRFSSGKRAVLRAKGDAIPNAVAVANIIMENMGGNSARAQSITVDSDAPPGIGRMTSTIEIVLERD